MHIHLQRHLISLPPHSIWFTLHSCCHDIIDMKPDRWEFHIPGGLLLYSNIYLWTIVYIRISIFPCAILDSGGPLIMTTTSVLSTSMQTSLFRSSLQTTDYIYYTMTSVVYVTQSPFPSKAFTPTLTGNAVVYMCIHIHHLPQIHQFQVHM